MDPFDTVTDADICMAISNANGHQPCLFVPEVSFHQLVKRQIWRLERPALETVEAVYMEMLVRGKKRNDYLVTDVEAMATCDLKPISS